MTLEESIESRDFWYVDNHLGRFLKLLSKFLFWLSCLKFSLHLLSLERMIS